MKIIKNCYESIGMFDSRIGDIHMYNEFMVIPVSNVQVDETFELNETNYIYIYDYAYFILSKVFLSERDVYLNNKIVQQEVYKNDKINYYNIYSFELIDFKNPKYQYWNWIIKAKSFSLGIPDYATSRKEYFENDKLNINHFYIKDFSFLTELG